MRVPSPVSLAATLALLAPFAVIPPAHAQEHLWTKHFRTGDLGEAETPASSTVIASTEAGRHRLALPGGEVFHETADPIVNLRTVRAPWSMTVLVLWDEMRGGGEERGDGLAVSHCAISFGGQALAGRVRETSYAIGLLPGLHP